MNASLIPKLDGDSLIQCSSSKLLPSALEKMWEYRDRRIESKQAAHWPTPLLATHHTQLSYRKMHRSSQFVVCVHAWGCACVTVCLCGKVIRVWSVHNKDFSVNVTVNTLTKKMRFIRTIFWKHQLYMLCKVVFISTDFCAYTVIPIAGGANCMWPPDAITDDMQGEKATQPSLLLLPSWCFEDCKAKSCGFKKHQTFYIVSDLFSAHPHVRRILRKALR